MAVAAETVLAGGIEALAEAGLATGEAGRTEKGVLGGPAELGV